MKLASAEKIAAYKADGVWGDETLYDVFRAAVAAGKDAIALVDPADRAALTGTPPRRLTWRALDQEVDRLSAALFHEGFRAGDILVVQMPNTIELVVTLLAGARLGLILSPVAVQYGRHELSHVMATLNPAGFIVANRFKDQELARTALGVAGDAPVLVWGEGCPRGATSLNSATRHPFDLDVVANEVRHDPPSADDCVTLCWTSGTTGTPKAVPRSHNHWLAIAPATYDALGIMPGDVLLNPFPLINMAAIGGVMVNWLVCAGVMVLHHPLNLAVFLDQLEQEKVTLTVAPPALLTLLLKRPELLAGRDLSHIRAIGSGSAPLSPFMITGWKARGVEIVNLFGSNEGVSLATGPNESEDPQARAAWFPRFGEPGLDFDNRMHSRVRCKLVALGGESEIAGAGMVGELRVKGPAVFEGYWGEDGAGPDVFDSEGYFRTGDLFEIAPDDRFFAFKGRSKDLIVRGGVKISASEVDALLDGLPGVVEIAVFPWPDEVMGERVAAAVVFDEAGPFDLGVIATFLMEKGVASYKIPERLVAVNGLPRNAVGKVLRWRIPEAIEEAAQSAPAEAAE